MTRIDTEIPDVIVEIEDREYPVAPRTVEVMERLIAAEKEYAGKPDYRLWLAELEILLGKAACAELFPAGPGENVDRLQRIFVGVVEAFHHADREISDSLRERDVRPVATALAPINELLKNLRSYEKKNPDGGVRMIPRK